jgi:hypothetical protein
VLYAAASGIEDGAALSKLFSQVSLQDDFQGLARL